MSFGSTVPHAMDGLITTVSARAALADVKILREWPRNEQDAVSEDGAAEAMWVGKDGEQSTEGTSDVVVMTAGRLRFDETYTLWLTLQVLQPEGTMESAAERAWTLQYEVVAAVAADPKLGVVQVANEVGFFEVRGYRFSSNTRFLAKGGAACQVVVGFDCHARIEAT